MRHLFMPLLSMGLYIGICASSITLPVRASLENNLKHTPAAEALAVIDTTPEHWRFLTQKEPFASGLREFQEEIRGDIAEELGLDLEEELLPMIGTHLNLAFYGNESVPVLVVVDLKPASAVADRAYAQLIAKLESKAQQDQRKALQKIDWKGHTLYGFQRTGKNKDIVYMSRTLDKTALLIGSLKRVKAGLIQQTPQINQRHFQPIYQRLKAQKFWFYGTPPALLKTLKAQKLQTEDLKEIGQYQHAGFGMDINVQGLLLKSVVELPQGPVLRALKTPSKTPERIRKTAPMHTLVFASASDLKALLSQDLKTILQDNQLKKFTGLNLYQDILAPGDGHLGLAIFYPPGNTDYDRPPQLVLSMGSKNPQTLQQALVNKLSIDLNALAPKKSAAKRRQARQMPPLRFIKKPVTRYRGVPIYKMEQNATLNNLQQALFIDPVMAQVDNLWLMGSNMDALKQSLDQIKGNAQHLGSNRYLSQLQSRYNLDPEQSTLFMDLRYIGDMLEFVAGEDEEVQALRPTLSAFRSLLVGSTRENNLLETVAVMDVVWQKVDFELLRKFK